MKVSVSVSVKVEDDIDKHAGTYLELVDERVVAYEAGRTDALELINGAAMAAARELSNDMAVRVEREAVRVERERRGR